MDGTEKIILALVIAGALLFLIMFGSIFYHEHVKQMNYIDKECECVGSKLKCTVEY